MKPGAEAVAELLSNKPLELEHDGKRFRFSMPGIADQAELSRLVRQAIMDDCKETLDSLEYLSQSADEIVKASVEDQKKEIINYAVQQAKRPLESDAAEGALATSILAYIGLKKNHPGMTRELASKILLNENQSKFIDYLATVKSLVGGEGSDFTVPPPGEK